MDAKQRAQARDQAMRNTSVVGAVVNLVLTVVKVIFGIVGQSHALIADGVHSLADLSTDLMVWFAAKYSNQPADKEHPYGHARIETAFTVGLGVVLIVTAAGIVFDSAQRLAGAQVDPRRLDDAGGGFAGFAACGGECGGGCLIIMAFNWQLLSVY